ncbi:hypothetical protein DFH09DRAFT_1349209 [Mycena vulgaris]|nr:hypothetical protein DFH09DRAFT_1349209 [Mycena vulgaris]
MDSDDEGEEINVVDLYPMRLSSRFQLMDSLLTAAYIMRISTFDCQTSTRHINDLPMEILANILLHVLPCFFYLPQFLAHDRWVVSCVCRSFRNTIADPRFWSTIYIDERTRPNALVRSLDRSQAADLHFCFKMLDTSSPDLPSFFIPPLDDPTNNDVMKLHWLAMLGFVEPCMSRCRSLSISTAQITGTVFLLRVASGLDGRSIRSILLSLRPPSMDLQRSALATTNDATRPTIPDLLGGALPSLTNLAVYRGLPLWAPSAVYSSLTTLRLEGLTNEFSPRVDELFDIFTTTHRLTHLYFINVLVEGFDDFVLEPPQLHHLTHLSFTSCTDSSSCFLSLILVPTLRTLRLEFMGDSDVWSFLDHCGAFLANVTEVSLKIELDTMAPFVQLLRCLPNIRYLDTRIMTSPFYLYMQAAMMHWSGLCPLLEVVLTNDYIEHAILLGMLSRSSSTHFGKNLRIVSPTWKVGNVVDTMPHDSTMILPGVVYSKPCVTPCRTLEYDFP